MSCLLAQVLKILNVLGRFSRHYCEVLLRLSFGALCEVGTNIPPLKGATGDDGATAVIARNEERTTK